MDQPGPLKSREATFLSASLTREKTNGFNDKTVFRSQKFPELKEHQFDSKNLNETNAIAAADTSCSRCASSIFPTTPVSPTNRKQNSGGRRTGVDNVCARCKHNMINEANDEPNRTQSPKRQSDRKKKVQRDNLDWDNLGEKIEDWFEVAKTPEQKVVYRFLKDIKDEEYENERNINSSLSVPESNVSDKAQSLEDILENLKKYRNKFSRKSSRSSLPKIAKSANNNKNSNATNGSNKDLLTMSNELLKNNFESSTWRVMRHLRSADIRNKYPLPKANPDYHFRNATVFHTAGRAPKSTFLLHPDWV